MKVEVRFEVRLQLPLFVEQGLHVGRMQPTDEIVASLSQPQKLSPHVLNHVHVHRIQIRQLATCGIPFPMPLISVENQSSIGNPPSEHERTRSCRVVAQVVPFRLGHLGVNDASVCRGQQPQEWRIRCLQPDLDRGAVDRHDAALCHRFEDPSSRRHNGGISQSFQRVDDILG